MSGRCPVESPACPSDAAALLSNPDPGTDMNRRCLCTAIAAFFLLGTALAHAQEIDELLDGGIPGDSQVGGRLGPLARPTIPLTTPTDPTLDLPRNVVQPVSPRPPPPGKPHGSANRGACPTAEGPPARPLRPAHSTPGTHERWADLGHWTWNDLRICNAHFGIYYRCRHTRGGEVYYAPSSITSERFIDSHLARSVLVKIKRDIDLHRREYVTRWGIDFYGHRYWRVAIDCTTCRWSMRSWESGDRDGHALRHHGQNESPFRITAGSVASVLQERLCH